MIFFNLNDIRNQYGETMKFWIFMQPLKYFQEEK